MPCSEIVDENWDKMLPPAECNCTTRVPCQNLKVAKKPFPLPGDLQYLWLDVTKIIDELHIKNHADKRCIEKYNPKEVLSEDMNTLSCEQTFAWLSGFENPECHPQNIPPLLLTSHGIKKKHVYFEVLCRREAISLTKTSSCIKEIVVTSYTIY